MEELKPFSEKVIKEITAIKKAFTNEIINKIGSNNTITFYCKYYEALSWEYIKNSGEFVANDTKLLLTIGELIKWVWEEEFVEDTKIEDSDYLALEKYFIKAQEAQQSSVAFLSLASGLFHYEIINETKFETKYMNKEIEKFENINNLLITDYLQQKGKELENTRVKGRKNRRYIGSSSFRAKSFLKAEFQLPDDYSILGFTIGQIKEFWFHIIKDAEEITDKNKLNFKKLITEKSELNYQVVNSYRILELDIDKWKLKTLNKEQVLDLLDKLSFNGKKKLKKIHSSIKSEPIIKLPDGRYIFIPLSISYYQAERYTLQVFDKFVSYFASQGHSVQTDSSKREDIFASKLNELFKGFNYKGDTVNISNSDIDYMVYDEKNSTLICFETKWIIEPFTPSEIKSKDINIKKALETQLPNYKKAVEENTQGILKKAFGKDFNLIPENYRYFVLTNITIGSGLLDRNSFKVINFRMLQKALNESNSNLLTASIILQNETYFQEVEKYFKKVSTSNDCFGVEISQPEFKYLGGFSL